MLSRLFRSPQPKISEPKISEQIISEPKLYSSSYTDSPMVWTYIRDNPHDPSKLRTPSTSSVDKDSTHGSEDLTRKMPMLREKAAAPSSSSSLSAFRTNFSRFGSRMASSDKVKSRSKPTAKGKLVISQPMPVMGVSEEEIGDDSDIANRLSETPWTVYSYDTGSGNALPQISLAIDRKVHLPSRVFDAHQIFGLHLEVLLERGHCDENHLPKILKHCTDYIRDQIGAGRPYDITDYVADQAGLRLAMESLDKGYFPQFDTVGSGVPLGRSRSRSTARHPVTGITLANSLLIKFFTALPNTLFPLNEHPVSIKRILQDVNEIEFQVLVHLMDFLSFAKTNSPTVSTTAIAHLFGPLVSHSNDDRTGSPYEHMQRLTDQYERYRDRAVLSRNLRQIGVSLKNLKANEKMDSYDLPQILSECTKYIRRHLMDEIGIFRTSAPTDQIQAAVSTINSGKTVHFRTEHQLLSASIVKRFCADLPNNILPNDLLFVDKLEIYHIVRVLANLNDFELKIFHHLFTFFRELTENKINEMTPDAMGRSIGPSLVHNIYLIKFEEANQLSAVSAAKLGIAADLKIQGDANAEAGNIVSFIITNYTDIMNEFCVTERVQELLKCKQNSAHGTGGQDADARADTLGMRIRK